MKEGAAYGRDAQTLHVNVSFWTCSRTSNSRTSSDLDNGFNQRLNPSYERVHAPCPTLKCRWLEIARNEREVAIGGIQGEVGFDDERHRPYVHDNNAVNCLQYTVEAYEQIEHMRYTTGL